MLQKRLLIVPAMLLVFSLGIASAQQGSNDSEDAVAAIDPMLDAPFLDWSHAKLAFDQAERWVRVGAVPEQGPELKLPLADLAGAKVTLRWLGMRVGVGEAYALPNSDQPEELMELVRLATMGALEDLERDLALRFEKVDGELPITAASIGPALQLDLQLARTPEPIHVDSDALPLTLLLQFSPGYHGIILSAPQADGSISEAWMWPATAVASNIHPRSQFFNLLSELGIKHEKVGEVGRPGGTVAHRFEVLHRVRPSKIMPAMQLVRGHEILPTTSLDSSTLDALVQRTTRWLTMRIRVNGTLAGSFEPTSGQFDPETAPVHEAALAIYALGRRAAMMRELDTSSVAASEELVAQIKPVVELLNRTFTAEEVGLNMTAASLHLMTLVQTPGLEEYKAQRDELAARLLSLQQKDGSFARAGKNDKEMHAFPLAQQAVAWTALVHLYSRTREADLLSAIGRSRTWLWGQSNLEQLGLCLPWIGMGELAYQRLVKASDAQQQQINDARLQWLGQVVDHWRSTQILKSYEDEPDDVVGGWRWEEAPTIEEFGPDWRTSERLIFLAMTLREPQLATGRDKLGWLLNCGLAARFLAQLTFDQPGCFYVRSPEEALGGVRQNLWDNKVGVVSTAMTLLAATELQQTLQNLDPDRALWHDGD